MNDQKQKKKDLPFAQVMILRPAPGLFTYSIPEQLDEKAKPGVRVVVPFGKRSVIGVVAERIETTGIET
ncbi:MAG: hypothetical protein OEZ32_07640, partial [Nitrospinota bacterium]|nr:hypothetical protein [Nitrospinota bacterium]